MSKTSIYSIVVRGIRACKENNTSGQLRSLLVLKLRSEMAIHGEADLLGVSILVVISHILLLKVGGDTLRTLATPLGLVAPDGSHVQIDTRRTMFRIWTQRATRPETGEKERRTVTQVASPPHTIHKSNFHANVGGVSDNRCTHTREGNISTASEKRPHNG
jgi:hypothetical protein